MFTFKEGATKLVLTLALKTSVARCFVITSVTEKYNPPNSLFQSFFLSVNCVLYVETKVQEWEKLEGAPTDGENSGICLLQRK